jgi:hypothetical protein
VVSIEQFPQLRLQLVQQVQKRAITHFNDGSGSDSQISVIIDGRTSFLDDGWRGNLSVGDIANHVVVLLAPVLVIGCKLVLV